MNSSDLFQAANTLRTLEKQREQLDAKIQGVLRKIQGGNGEKSTTTPATMRAATAKAPLSKHAHHAKRKPLSAKARRAIAAAQKRRWAMHRAEKAASAAPSTARTGRKRAQAK